MKTFITLIACLIFFPHEATSKANEKIVHIYGWHNSIPDKVIKAFELETGIKVKFDLLDSNEVLQVKLLAGNSGYDIVFPTTWPYLAFQVPTGLYHKIDKTKLTNYRHLDPVILKRLTAADPDNQFAVPFSWGLVVLGYNEEKVKAGVPEQYHDSWALLYAPEVTSKIADCGIAMLEDATDVFYSVYMYLGFDLTDTSPATLNKVTALLKETRPFIKKFDISLSAEQLASGELCMAQQWLDILMKAQHDYSHIESHPKLKIILPKEGTIMWVDNMAIPNDAPHIENAYKFIDFLLRPEISAIITNELFLRTAIKTEDIQQFIQPEIRSNKLVFPDKDYLEKTHLTEITSKQFQRQMTRAFYQILSGH